MTNSSDQELSLDNLEQQWSAVAERMWHPQKILKPINVPVCLRDFKKSLFQFEQLLKQKQFAQSRRVPIKTYTTEEILLLWEALKQKPEVKNNPKILRILVKEIIFTSIQPLISDPELLDLIQSNPMVFYTPVWLRRFYYFFFNDLYLKQPIGLLSAWAITISHCCQHLKQDGSLLHNGSLKLRYVALVKTVERSTSTINGFQRDYFETYLNSIFKQAPSEAQQRVEGLEDYYRRALGFDILPDGIRLYCQQQLFSIYLAQYLANRDDMSSLNNLLEQFCHLDNQIGQEHLIRLITEAYGDPSVLRQLSSPIKACIKAFLLRTIKDPRLNHAAWGSLKDRNMAIYSGLRYWFVEADFNLFFDFAFRHSRDDHHRKELWMRFLKQAHDFRVFLPSTSFQEFKKAQTDDNRHAQVYENPDNITGFILCIDKLIIYEAVETRNSAYVYDTEELKKLSTPESKKVLRFLDVLFTKNEMPKYTGSRTALAHPDLAPLTRDWHRTIRSRRFTHDQNRLWHYDVLNYLKTMHFIVPDRQN